MPTPITFEVLDNLKICRDVEICCADLYSALERQFAEDEELRHLWHKMSNEEHNHAEQFTLAINLRREGVITRMQVDKQKASFFLKRMQELYNKIIATPQSDIKSLEIALSIEKNLSTLHVSEVAAFEDEGLKQLFHRMMLSDNEHAEALDTVYKKRMIQQEEADLPAPSC